MAWVVIAALLIGALALAAYCVDRIQREPVELEEFRAAVAELEHAIGEALLPVLERTAEAIVAWRDRWRS